MSHGFRAVQWTPFKRRFDAWMGAGIGTYLASFLGVTAWLPPAGESFTPAQAVIRATGTLAFLMLSFLLCIGPLARLTPRFKPFLYNRRHLGVATCAVAVVHAATVLVWYHGFGVLDPLVSLLASNPRYDALAGFPFELPGLVALGILLCMAATSHDFWNAMLGPRGWKRLHRAVYLAYALLVVHVALGALQSEPHPAYAIGLAACAAVVGGLQLSTALRASGRVVHAAPAGPWLRVGLLHEIPDHRALVVQPADGERIAVFRTLGRVAAVSNVCRHQGGPLGEGRVIDGCVTCPWHGHQYRLEDGCAPPPYTERIATYRTRIEDGVVFVDPRALPPGTPVAPSHVEDPQP